MANTSTESTTYLSYSANLQNTGPTGDDWKKHVSAIEGQEFADRLSVVSGTRAFYNAVSREPVTRDLFREMSRSGEAREYVLGELENLARLNVDPRYENPHDAALAALLWLAYFTDEKLADIAASAVDVAPQCWYAKKFARAILDPPPVPSESSPFPKVASNLSGSIQSPNDSKMTLRANLGGKGWWHHGPIELGGSTAW